MKVTLVDYTGAGSNDPADYAASMLIFAKNTRLEMSPSLLDEIKGWSPDRKLRELEYIANTIPASHEFVHLTFLVTGVTRAFTHQFVRSRTFSFAQQTMRVLDVKGWEYGTGPTILADKNKQARYDNAMRAVDGVYRELIDQGAAVEDARGILPTNIHTNIMMSCNLRGFIELVQKRSSPRVQVEYRAVLEAMKQAVLEVYPWVGVFLARSFDRAVQDLTQEIEDLPTSRDHKMKLHKLMDQVRQKQ
jgi:flavin-dependent thymidylate synthase